MLFPVLVTVATALTLVPGLHVARNETHAGRRFAYATTHATDDTTRHPGRLTVRPRTMATGTRTPRGGLTPLDGFDGYSVYVPLQCVGTKRSPLIVLLHGGGRSGLQEVTKFQTLADTYGMIVLAGNALQPGRWDIIGGMGRDTRFTARNGSLEVSASPDRDVRHLDSALTKVLRTHAIDPGRIALLGFSDGGSYARFLGLSNLDIFSRVAALSALIPFDGLGPKNTSAQFFLSGGMNEPQMVKRTLAFAQTLRQRGHPVVTQIGLRGHVDYVEDERVVWEWLQTSWADPGTTNRVSTESDADPVLTPDILQQMTTFWTRFQQLPDSIRTVLRMRHQTQVPLTVGAERTTIITMNLTALAATASPVAALLDSVGLTARTATAYRTAIIRAGIARAAGMVSGIAPNEPAPDSEGSFAPIPPTSVLGRNLAFWKTHEAAFIALAATGMWTTQ